MCVVGHDVVVQLDREASNRDESFEPTATKTASSDAEPASSSTPTASSAASSDAEPASSSTPASSASSSEPASSNLRSATIA